MVNRQGQGNRIIWSKFQKKNIILSEDVHPLNEYVTPAEDDKFSEFQITDSIPSNGTNGGMNTVTYD